MPDGPFGSRSERQPPPPPTIPGDELRPVELAYLGVRLVALLMLCLGLYHVGLAIQFLQYQFGFALAGVFDARNLLGSAIAALPAFVPLGIGTAAWVQAKAVAQRMIDADSEAAVRVRPRVDRALAPCISLAGLVLGAVYLTELVRSLAMWWSFRDQMAAGSGPVRFAPPTAGLLIASFMFFGARRLARFVVWLRTAGVPPA